MPATFTGTSNPVEIIAPTFFILNMCPPILFYFRGQGAVQEVPYFIFVEMPLGTVSQNNLITQAGEDMTKMYYHMIKSVAHGFSRSLRCGRKPQAMTQMEL